MHVVSMWNTRFETLTPSAVRVGLAEITLISNMIRSTRKLPVASRRVDRIKLSLTKSESKPIRLRHSPILQIHFMQDIYKNQGLEERRFARRGAAVGAPSCVRAACD